MTDLMSTMGNDPAPPTTEPVGNQPTAVPGMELPQGVHPGDRSVPLVPGQPVESNSPTAGDNLGKQGQRRRPPWDTENEEALPVYQRAAHDWTANQFALASNNPIQIAGRLRGAVSTVVWVPSSAANGVVISPNEGDITQGAGITLSPGDSIELCTEGAVSAGVSGGNATGTVYVVRLYNPPGGGLGLSAA
jgi:hypothetical protein